MKTFLLALASASLIAGSALAHDYKIGDLKIEHPSIPQPLTRAMTAAGYLRIVNQGTAPDRLIGLESDTAASLQIHTTDHGTDGTARMRHIEALDLPAGETTALEQGGYHIMLMGLTKGLTEGDVVKATLTFEKAGQVEVDFHVEAPKGGAHDHGATNDAARAHKH